MNRMTRIGALSLLMAAMLTCASMASADVISLPDGTLEASVSGGNNWYGNGLAASGTIDAQNVATVVIHGSITALSHPLTSFVQIGLVPSSIAVPEADLWGQGVYAVSWESMGNGLSLEADKEKGPFAWVLDEPSEALPWDFTITLKPSGANGGTATFAVAGHTLSDTTPLAYTGDYSEAVLLIQILNHGRGASVSYTDVSVSTTVPEPASALLLGIASLVLLRRRHPAHA